MSAHGHATPGDAAASHDHHYEGIPADRPGPDEPRTPLWLPLLGIGLLLTALLAFVLTRPPGKTGAELAAEAVPAASVAAAPAPSASVNPRVRRLPPGVASMFPQGGMPPGTVPGGAARPAMTAAGRPLQAPAGAARVNPGSAPPAPRPRPAPPPPAPPQ
jgi:hypothetical protein